MRRRTMIIVAACFAAMSISGTAMAGNWATTTLDEAPDQFRMGVTHEVTYTVLQHGTTPVDGSTAIVFRPAKGTMSSPSDIRFKGFPTGEPGQYRAQVELPVSGVWIWEVEQGPFGTFDLGSVEVGTDTAGSFLFGDGSRLLVAGLAGAGLLLVAGVLRQASRPKSAPASRMTSRM